MEKTHNMIIKDGHLVMETCKCHWCGNNRLPIGKMPGLKLCHTCNGTRKGKRGGRGGCKDCYDGKESDWDNPVDCTHCKGLGYENETITDAISDELWKSLKFKVYISNRGSTWNESNLGLGCVYSSCDYGTAFKKISEDISKSLDIIEEVKNSTWIQACKIANDDGTLCNHIAILVHQNGYSVRAAFELDASDVLSQADTEPLEDEGLAIGIAVANAGGHGTLAAAGFKRKNK